MKHATPAQKILSQVPERFKPLQLSVKEMEAVEVSYHINFKEWWCIIAGLSDLFKKKC
jgi:hypothetical protein